MKKAEVIKENLTASIWRELENYGKFDKNEKIMEPNDELAVIEKRINEKCQEIPHAGNILEISGIGENTLAGILAEMGDISRFDDVKEIQTLSGLGLVACSSGKHKGETKISHR